MKRIPSLDGFRAVSIMLVLFCHSRYSTNFPAGLAGIAGQAEVGVTVFFVISGFLITGLLLKEEEIHGKINLGDFYIRRAFRILPVFFCYTLFITIWKNHEDMGVTKNNIIHAFSFTVNFEKKCNWFLGHLWSVFVEEQFYLIWPALLILCRKYIKPVLVALILYSCIARITGYKFPAYRNITLSPFFMYSDAIFIGAFGAVLYADNPAFIMNKKFDSYLLQLVASGLLILFVYTAGYGKLPYFSLPFGGIIIGMAILYLLLCYIRPSDNIIYKILNHKVMVHIGVLSYSIYIWQEFFFVGKYPFVWRTFPLNILVIYMVALASYHLLEKPFLKLRKIFLIKAIN